MEGSSDKNRNGRHKRCDLNVSRRTPLDELVQTLKSLKRVFITFGVLAIIVAIIYVQGTITHAFLLYYSSIVIAVLLKWLADLLKQVIPVSYKLSLAIVIFVIVGSIVLFWVLSGPSFSKQVQNLAVLLTKATKSMRAYFEQYSWGHRLIDQVSQPNNFFNMGVSGIIGNITKFFETTFEFIGEAIFVSLMGIFLALEPELYYRSAVRLFLPSRRAHVEEVFQAINISMQKWLLGRFISMLLITVLTITGLAIVGVPLPVLLGIIAGVLTFIPFLGPILSSIPAILVAFTVSPTMVLWVVLIYLLAHLVDNITTPVIQQRVTFLPPALLVSAQIILTMVGGPLGLLFAAPITLTVIIVIQVLYFREYLGEKVTILGQNGGGKGS
jgi:predicted PurR-regulated permease PerM